MTEGPIDQDRLAEVEARAVAATEGPWHVEYDIDGWDPEGDFPHGLTGPANTAMENKGVSEAHRERYGRTVTEMIELTKADAEFIARAREDIPWLIGEAKRLNERVAELEPAPCRMTHVPPFDFAECRTHDTTFPLGGICKFHDRDMVDVLWEEADQQRGRAVLAEMEAERLRAELDGLRSAGWVGPMAGNRALDGRADQTVLHVSRRQGDDPSGDALEVLIRRRPS